MQRPDSIEHIVIVGGGSAGWLTAGLLAGEYRLGGADGLRITLVESPDVQTIGVGEGTWPTMRSTLQRIGIGESEFLIECSASFKQGTRFDGWRTGAADDRYYHPFSPPAAYARLNLAPYWQARADAVSFADAVTPQGQVCDRDLAPRPLDAPDFSALLNYGYHLDAGRFAALLQRHCTERLGVRHVLDHVTAVNGAPDEDIRSVATAAHGEIAGDLFIDCTGFGALLLNGHYGISFVDRRDVLFNDSALAVQVPYGSATDPVASQTISTAQAAGWTWDIGLSSRRGVGYTWSSAHGDDAAAHGVLAAYVKATAGLALEDLEPRKIGFRPGHRERFWHRNCVAVGMAAGFLEPLEASALVLIELAGRMIAEQLPATRATMDTVARRFNETFRYRWDRIVDFLKLHYVLSERTDTAYWIDQRDPDGIPASLSDLLDLWRDRAPWHRDFPQRDEVFSSASYQYVLYGMGFRSTNATRAPRADRSAEAVALFEENARRTRQQLGQLPSNRDILSYIEQRGAHAA
ncbi:MAG: tryptophan 7-halogenase [Xanthomonadales bacterium]